MRRISRSSLLRFFSYQAAFSAIGLARWIGNSFGDTSVDQILWQLRYTERAAVHMGGIFLVEFIFEVLVFPAMFALIAALLHTGLLPYATRWKRLLLRAAPAAAGVVGLGALLLQFSVFSYAEAQFEPDLFARAYVNPQRVRTTERQRRNLVLVYAESLEQTYENSAVFGRDLLSATRTLGGHSFPSYRMAAGASWTIAAMVGTQCGVPLKVYTETDVRHREDEKTFLPRATCLGDLLHQHGYRNVFMGGAPLSFAGKGAFLRDHGYDEAWGREEWEQSGLRPEEVNEWGLYDSAVYERARKRLQELHASGQPFNLTVLTLDTHNPHGFYSPYCRNRGAVDFEGIVTCAGDQIASFVDFIRQQGYLKDTVVVVLGDHLAKPNPVYDKLQEVDAERRIFNLFLSDPQPAPNTDDLVAFDVYPTLVEMLGFDVRGDRLGLGYSAVGKVHARRPDPLEREEQWSVAALRGSGAYNALWDPPAGSTRAADAPDQRSRGVSVHEGD